MNPHNTLRSQRGAVLLLALLAVALIVSLLGSVMGRQADLIRVESAERERQQAQWLLLGAMDWARLILREDARNGNSDHLSEPWAVPLQDSRLSSFLATQPVPEGALPAPEQEVLLSGGIQDAQGRFNLSNLVQGQQVDGIAKAQLTRLFGVLGVPQGRVEDLADKMARSRQPNGAWLPPQSLDDLVAWGWDRAQIERLRPHVVVLPERTRINVNTASPEVLSATVQGLSLAAAERLAMTRLRSPWTHENQAQAAFGEAFNVSLHGVSSQYFLLIGRLRLGRTDLSQMALVKREGPTVAYRWVKPFPTPTRP